MPELPDEPADRVRRLLDEGDGLLDEGDCEQALTRYRTAWEMLAEPRTDQPVALDVLAATGDAHFVRGDFVPARDALMAEVYRAHADGLGRGSVRVQFTLANLGS